MDERSARGMNYNVTVIGAGRMGSALATVLFHKGFATTVWNRTGAKTKVLSRLGLSVAQSVEESVREADIVVVSVSDYSSTRQLLRQPDMETALRGKIVVQLSSGTPKEAREMDSWARMRNILSRRRHTGQSGMDWNTSLHDLLFRAGGSLPPREAGSDGLWR